MKEHLYTGDDVIVWELDRLDRGLKDLFRWISYLDENDIIFRSLQEIFDSTTPSYKLIVLIFGSLAGYLGDMWNVFRSKSAS